MIVVASTEVPSFHGLSTSMDLVEPDLGDPDASTSPKVQEVNKTSLKLSSSQDTYLSLLEVFETGDLNKTPRAY
jgi:hypothetical protein